MPIFFITKEPSNPVDSILEEVLVLDLLFVYSILILDCAARYPNRCLRSFILLRGEGIMLNRSLHWRLSQKPERAVKKHCKMCGKGSVFTDTNVRRHNANGKSIYQYAIYKCEKKSYVE